MPLNAADDRKLRYENPHKDEAARFITGSFQREFYFSLIDGMDRIERIECWESVLQRIEPNNRQSRKTLEKVEQRLKDRRARLKGELDQQAEFQPASDLESAAEVDEPAQEAVADGGAELGTVEEVADGQREIGDGQERMEYEDDADFESQKRDAASLAKMFSTVEDVEQKIDEEYQRETVRPHVVEALEDRLEVLGE